MNSLIRKLRIKKWIKDGLIVGKNFQLERNSFIDSSFPWLIQIGDNVTIAPDSLILSHDGSTQKFVGYSRLGKVKIGNNVFIGAKCIILPNTTIGDNTIIGAGSIVKGNVDSDSIYCGIIAKKIKTIEEFKIYEENKLKDAIKYGIEYTKKGKINKVKKREMINEEKDMFVI